VTDALTYNLGSTTNSGIEHVVNDQGASVITAAIRPPICHFYEAPEDDVPKEYLEK